MAASIFICLVSLIIFLLPVIVIFRTQKKNRNLKLTIYVFALVLISRVIVGICGAGEPENNLTMWESFCDSLVHTLQTFSLDENYDSYITAGKELLLKAGRPEGALAFGFILSILNVCAPVLGGALLLEILADIFPYIKLFLHPFREKYIFSELNIEAVTLAEDLIADSSENQTASFLPLRWKPVIVFTDAYPDMTSEPRSELFERAKSLSAICIKTDLLHLSFRLSGKISYFLIDQKSQDNVTAFERLLERDNKGRWRWPAVSDTEEREGPEKEPLTSIYIFTKADIENQLIWRACDGIGEDISKVLVRPIRDYMNSTILHVFEVPLFVPLLGKERESSADLYLTILGSGAFAEEAFKAAFWYGQINGVQLHIDVLAENIDSFETRLRDNCAELLDSCTFENDMETDRCSVSRKESGQPQNERAFNPVLVVDPMEPEGLSNPPYCILHFRKVKDITAWSTWPSEILDRTDYYFVALGDDTQNIKVTEKIRLQIVRREGGKNDTGAHKVISPVIFDQGITKLIKQDRPGDGEPYVIPFAQFDTRFSRQNVLLDIFQALAEEGEKLYNADSQKKIQKDEYSYWANVVRVLHVPYKLFGLGLIEEFLPEKEGWNRFKIQSPYKVSSEEDEALAYIEHRRWNAFMRVQGFTCPTQEQFNRYYRRHCEEIEREKRKEKPDFKDIRLKFHPCLVERGMKKTILPEKLSEQEALPAGYDCLDHVMAAHHKEYKIYDYKEYDPGLLRYLE